MKPFTYAAVIDTHPEGDVTITFPDLPEAITGAPAGTGEFAVIAQAADALEEAVLGRLARDESVPVPRRTAKGEVAIALDPVAAARVALDHARRDAGLNKSQLAARLGKDEKAVRRMLGGAEAVRIESVLEALASFEVRPVLALA